MVSGLRRILREYFAEIRASGRNPRHYLAGLFLLGLGQAVFSLLFNLYLRSLGIPDSTIGQILSKIALGAAVAAIPAAFLFRTLPARSILVPAGALVALMYVLQAAVTTSALILLFAFLSGMALTVIRLSIPPVLMAEVAPGSRPYLFSASFTMLFLSAIFGSALGGVLPHVLRLVTDSDRAALRGSLCLAGALSLVSVIPFRKMERRSPETADQPTRDLRTQIRELADVDWMLHAKLVLPSLLIGLGAGLIIPFLNLYFRDRFGLSEAAIGGLFGVMQGFMVAGNLFGPAVSKSLGLVGGVVATQLASVPFMVLLAFSNALPVVALAFCLRSGLMNMNQPLTSHFAMEVVPARDHAVTNSLLSLSWFLSWTVSAEIGGALIERHGYTLPLLLAAGLYVCASVLYWLFFKGVEESRVPRGEVEIPEA